MSVLLHISASPRGSASHSRRIGRQLVERLQHQQPDVLEIVERDLVAAPPPYPDRAFVDAMLMHEAQRGEVERDALALSETLIGEIEAAGALVIDTPMHNFTVPAALKAWIDHVVRVGRTFRNTPEGKVGLLADRPVFVVIACGGPVPQTPTPGAQVDFLTPYLSYVLATIGIRSVSSLRLDALGRGNSVEVAAVDARAAEWLAATASAFTPL